jgi:type II secretory pathway pseudopilin PulG
MAKGTTLAELLVVLALVGGIAALGMPILHRMLDRGAVEQAAARVAMAHRTARALALQRGSRVTLRLSEDSLTISLIATGAEVLWRQEPGPASRRVTLVASRAELTFAPTGLGWGPANTTIRLSRGRAAAAFVTSRLGRLRRVE